MRRAGWIAPTLMICASLVAADDGTILSVDRGANAEQVRLAWTGNHGSYGVFRSPVAVDLVHPTNKLGEVTGESWIDEPPAESLLFYSVAAPAEGVRNVRDYGAVGDGSTDDTAAINEALAAGGVIYFPPGTYIVSATLDVTVPAKLTGAGPGITTIHRPNTGPGATVEVTTSYVTISELTLEGPTASDTLVLQEDGILARGSSAQDPLRGVRIENVEVMNFGFIAIRLRYVEQSSVKGCIVRRAGYAGLGCETCTDVVASSNHIRSIKPGIPTGLGANAYGIYFSYLQPTDPSSTRCIAEANTIQDVPDWEALDTHSGTFITFANNVIEGCRTGIYAGAQPGRLMEGITIVGNSMKAGAESHKKPGIIVSGPDDGPLAFNVLVSGNVVDGYGELDGDDCNPSAAAVMLQNTGGAIVVGNVVQYPAESGIKFDRRDFNFLCSNNLIDSVSSNTTAAAIRVREIDRFCAPEYTNYGLIIGNRSNGFPLIPPNPVNVTVGDNDL